MQKNLRMSKKSSNFAAAFENKHVSLAQLVEQLTLNQWVESSSLSGDTRKKELTAPFFEHRRINNNTGAIVFPP